MDAASFWLSARAGIAEFSLFRRLGLAVGFAAAAAVPFPQCEHLRSVIRE
jgi:hypothetical protein